MKTEVQGVYFVFREINRNKDILGTNLIRYLIQKTRTTYTLKLSVSFQINLIFNLVLLISKHANNSFKINLFISSISFPTFLTKTSHNDNLHSFSISAYKRNQLWCNNTSICQNHYKKVCFSRILPNDACVKMF